MASDFLRWRAAKIGIKIILGAVFRMAESIIIVVLLGSLVVLMTAMPLLDLRARRRRREFRFLSAPKNTPSVTFLRSRSGPANRPKKKPGAHTYETFLGPVHFKGTRQQGDFGELLTAVMVTSQGYVQLPSQYNRNNGLDGVFVRREKPGAFSHVIIAETKTGQARIDSDIMTDAGVRRRLDQMYAKGLLTYETTAILIKMLDEKSPNFAKQLWQHRLATGETFVYTLDANQNFVGDAIDATNKGLFEAVIRNMVTVGKLVADVTNTSR